MELTTLRYFLAIADAGHMTRAAAALGVTQPALSAAVKKLEAECGVPLLDRTGRGVEPTAAGLAFAERAREAVRQADLALADVRQLAGLERGVIRLGAGATAVGHLIPPVVGRVQRAHPELTFAIRELGSADVAHALLDGELDLGIVTLPVDTRSAAHDARDLMTIATAEDELMLIVPAGHALAGRKTFRWADIAGQPVVGFEAGSAVRAILDEAAASHAAALDVVMELRSIDSIRRMVHAGIGVGFVSRFALKSSEGLSCRDGRVVRTLGVVRRRDKVPSPAAAVFETELLRSLDALR